MSRRWPALDIRFDDLATTDLVQGSLVDSSVSAIEELGPDHWCVYFSSEAAQRAAEAVLTADHPRLHITLLAVDHGNWAARPQADLRAVRVADVTVAPPWDSHHPDGLTVIIRPAIGFGTGHHATTRLCLGALQRLDLRGRDVLDVGTGSGVLAIAASLLGAADVRPIDVDADALASARDNIALNPRARVTFALGDLRDTIPPADVVVGNLTGGLLVVAAPSIRKMIAPDGTLVLSGILDTEHVEFLAALNSQPSAIVTSENEWRCISFSALPARLGTRTERTAP